MPLLKAYSLKKYVRDDNIKKEAKYPVKTGFNLPEYSKYAPAKSRQPIAIKLLDRNTIGYAYSGNAKGFPNLI
jgi:hypothetical protein